VGVELIAAGTGRVAGVGRQTGWPSLDSPTASRYNAFSGRSPGVLRAGCFSAVNSTRWMIVTFARWMVVTLARWAGEGPFP